MQAGFWNLMANLEGSSAVRTFACAVLCGNFATHNVPRELGARHKEQLNTFPLSPINLSNWHADIIYVHSI